MNKSGYGTGERIFEAVVIAALSAAFTGLATWGIDELKKRYGSVEEEEEIEEEDTEEEPIEETD